MSELWAILTGFPAAIPTVLMAVALVYWLFVILGALDIDLLPFDGHDSHDGHDLGHGNPNVVLEFLRIGQVPITLIASVFVFLWWAPTLVAAFYLHRWLPGWSWWLAGSAILAATAVAAFIATGLAMRPLARAFAMQGGVSSTELIGRAVEVTSSAVDERFGTARYDGPGNADIILNVVCRPGQRLSRGEQAVVMEHDPATGVYTIAPLPHTRPGFIAEEGAAPPAAGAAIAAPAIQPTAPQPVQPQ